MVTASLVTTQANGSVKVAFNEQEQLEAPAEHWAPCINKTGFDANETVAFFNNSVADRIALAYHPQRSAHTR